MPERLQVLLPERDVGAVGGADVGDLVGPEPEFRVHELDQDGVARQRLQQEEGGGEGDPEDEQRLPDPAEDVARHEWPVEGEGSRTRRPDRDAWAA